MLCGTGIYVEVGATPELGKNQLDNARKARYLCLGTVLAGLELERVIVLGLPEPLVTLHGAHEPWLATSRVSGHYVVLVK